MKNAARRLLLAGLSVLVCFFSFCTINDDNGNPIDPGAPAGPSDPAGPTAAPVLIISPDSSYVSVGGTIEISVLLLSSDAEKAAPISRGRIYVKTTSGTLSADSIITNTRGEAAVRLTGRTEGSAVMTFTYGNLPPQTVLIAITNNPTRNFTLIASPSVLLADGLSTSTITVQAKNEDNNPIIGDSIRFRTTFGMITAASVTDENGRATAKLTSDRRNAIATVKAWLKNDEAFYETIKIEFSGVTISATAAPTSIKPTGDTAKDFSTVLMTLLDASGNPIVGERVTFKSSKSDSDIFSRDSVTDNRGEARCKIASRDSKTDTITVDAAGAEAKAAITFSNQNLTIVPAPANQRFIANPKDSTTFEITYTNGAGTGISDARLEISLTMGTTVNQSNDVVFACTLKTNSSGKATFKMQNPSFTSIATIFVKAYSGSEFTTQSYTQYFQANAVKKIDIVGTPSTININGATAKITATAFDSLGNRVSGAIISFNMSEGPGGGEYLEPATAATAADGTASTYLISGTIPSVFKGVRIKASDFAGNESNTISFTIAGPPHNISVNRNIKDVVTYPAAYGSNVAVLVTDINGNPVADGAEVTFSTVTTGYRFFPLQANFYNDTLLDLNDNKVLQRNYSIYNKRVLIESEHFNKNRQYKPFPPFEDINWSGVPERWSPDLDHPHNLDSRGSHRYNNPIKPCDPEGLEIVNRRITCNGLFANYNSRSGVWDTIKKFDNHESFTNAQLDALYNEGHRIIDNEYRPNDYNWDIDWIGNGIAEPQGNVLITRTAFTKDGIAENELIYGQSAAWRYQVKLSVECHGLIASTPEFILPIEEGAADYWSYRY